MVYTPPIRLGVEVQGVQDAVAALRSALEEMQEALGSLPDDLSTELRKVIAQAESVLEQVRTKGGPTNSG